MALRDYINISTRAELYNYVMQPDQCLLAIGITTAGDTPAELWYFSAASMAVDDGVTVIKPTATPVGNPGRYLRGITESDWSSTNNKPTFSAVATSGSYNDLSNKPTIPNAQVNSDWNSVSGLSQILNKPIIPAAQIQSDWNQASSGSLDFIKNKPSIPTVKRTETYLGSTDASGNYTVTYGTAFSTIPDVQPQLQTGTTSQVVRITNSTTTGFTVQVTNRASVTLLGIEVLLAATTPVNGASVGVLVTAR